MTSEESMLLTSRLAAKYPVNCAGCNACCYYPYFPMETEMGWDTDKARSFWNKDFVIDQYTHINEENQYCPLATPEGCLIYEERPLLCRNVFCTISSKRTK